MLNSANHQLNKAFHRLFDQIRFSFAEKGRLDQSIDLNPMERVPSGKTAMAPAYDPSESRQIRIFISSTFRDMHEERELLVKHVFPELRRICAERFVTFTEVDLRWGITEEQAAEGKVLPICLEEIYRCRPYFIGLLGEHYGWTPETVPPEVLDREPWLKEHVKNRTSVTELEILHGVLNNPDMANHSFFYFRDPSYIDSIPEKDRNDFVEDDEEKAEKLKRLKEKIRNKGMPVLENYANPNVLAEAVRKQLTELIDRLYPREEVPDPLDQEAMGHESYGWNKLQAYVERSVQTAALDAFAEAKSTGQGLVITSESGGGKTSLLASWVRHWREKHPDDFVFVHYFGSTPESASADGFLRRLLGELKRRFDITDEIPGEPYKLREALPLWLAQTVGKRRIFLVLDGLNQIEGNEPDRSLRWIPRYFPEHVHVVASSLEGSSLEALREHRWKEHELPLPDMAERVRMIQSYMGHHRKTLRADLSDQIAGAEGSSNPLFLRTVLEELRQFGSFEQLPDRVAHYLQPHSPQTLEDRVAHYLQTHYLQTHLQAHSPPTLFRSKTHSLQTLFGKVLQRWREDFDDDCYLVCRALCFLLLARQGLAEIIESEDKGLQLGDMEFGYRDMQCIISCSSAPIAMTCLGSARKSKHKSLSAERRSRCAPGYNMPGLIRCTIACIRTN